MIAETVRDKAHIQAQHEKLQEMARRLSRWEIQIDIEVEPDKIVVIATKPFSNSGQRYAISKEQISAFDGDIDSYVRFLAQHIVENQIVQEVYKELVEPMNLAVANFHKVNK